MAQGLGAGRRNTPTLWGVAFGRSFNWDGRSDSLWGQALGPIESAHEMGSSRVEVVRLVAGDADLRGRYERVFGPIDRDLRARLPAVPCGPLPSAPGQAERSDDPRACWQGLAQDLRQSTTRVFVNVGKAIAAYEATLRPGASRFDRFVRDLAAGDARGAAARLTPAEQRGLRLFIATPRTGCLNCHNGPMLSNGGFHDVGTNLGTPSTLELGHMLGSRLLEASEFRCDGAFSDALPAQCTTLNHQVADATGEGRGAFKVPTLRGVARTAPYAHDGRFADLKAVLNHYRAPPTTGRGAAHELKPLALTDRDVDDLVRFLGTL